MFFDLDDYQSSSNPRESQLDGQSTDLDPEYHRFKRHINNINNNGGNGRNYNNVNNNGRGGGNYNNINNNGGGGFRRNYNNINNNG